MRNVCAIVFSGFLVVACKGKQTSEGGGSSAVGSGSAAATPAGSNAGGSGSAGGSAGSAGAPGSNATAGSAAPTADWRPAAIAPGVPDEFRSWDLLSKLDAWQGAFVVDLVSGYKVAIGVAQDKLSWSDGKADKTMRIAIESPCSMHWVEKSSGGDSATTIHFTVKDGNLITGYGDAGYLDGNKAIACVSDVVYFLDGKNCTKWHTGVGVFKSEASKCSLTTKAGKTVFATKHNGSSVELVADGGVLLGPSLAGKSLATFPDFASAAASLKR